MNRIGNGMKFPLIYVRFFTLSAIIISGSGCQIDIRFDDPLTAVDAEDLEDKKSSKILDDRTFWEPSAYGLSGTLFPRTEDEIEKPPLPEWTPIISQN